MAGTNVYRGRYVPGPSAHFLVVVPGVQRSSVGPKGTGSDKLILYKIGGRVGRNGANNAIFRLFIANTVASGEGVSGFVPATVLAYTDEMTTSVVFTGSNQGEPREGNITPILVDENAELAFGAAVRGSGTLSVGMDTTNASYIHERDITAGSTIPQNGYTSRPAFGRNLIWAEGEKNVRPNQPGAVVISGGTGNQRPTMTAGFSDPNETLNNGVQYDHLDSIRQELWWGGTRRWNPGVQTATTAERNARQSQRQVGVDVPYNTPAEYRVWHIDRAGDESLVRSVTFTVLSGAVVDQPTAPSGRVTNLANPGGITAVYRNAGSLNANAVRVGLFSSGGTLIKESPILARTVVPNASTTVTWADSTFGTLGEATGYQIRMRARDSNNVWGEWSAPVIITTNARPGTPTLLAPNADPRSTLPDISVRVTDPDQPPADIDVEIQVYSGSTLIGTAAAPLNIGHEFSNVYTLSAANLASIITSHGTYTFRAQADDGYLSSPWSTQWTIIYAAVPSVTIEAPTSPISTSEPTFEWISPGQTHWRIVGMDGGIPVYDTGVQAGSDQIFQIGGSQYWLGGERWNNLEAFTFTVMARDSSTLWGSSDPLTLTLEYDPIDELVIDGGAESLPGMTGTHYNHPFIQPSTYDQSEFAYYDWHRVYLVGDGGPEIEGTRIHLARVTNSARVHVYDFDVPSRQWVRYYVVQGVYVGNDLIESEPVSIDMVTEFNGVLMHMPFDPVGTAVLLPYGATQYDPEVEWFQGGALIQPVNSVAPVWFSDGTDHMRWIFETTLLPRDGATIEQQRDAFRRIWRYQNHRFSPNGRPNQVCFREGQGGEDALVYGRISEPRRTHAYQGRYTIQFSFQELAKIPAGSGVSG